MKNILLSISFIFLVAGCIPPPNPRTETVIDRIYTPKECPTFDNDLSINGSKYNKDKTYNETMVITDLDSFLVSLEQNKLARETFNNEIIESNKEINVVGIPETSNFIRVEKHIFVNRECPSFYYSPEIKAKKLTPNFTHDNNTTYVVISLDTMVIAIEKNRLARETYNSSVDDINKKSYVDTIKEKYDDTIDIVMDKISETTDKIKEKIVSDSKDITKTYVIEKITK